LEIGARFIGSEKYSSLSRLICDSTVSHVANSKHA
jgi:hypothetical protein